MISPVSIIFTSLWYKFVSCLSHQGVQFPVEVTRISNFLFKSQVFTDTSIYGFLLSHLCFFFLDSCSSPFPVTAVSSDLFPCVSSYCHPIFQFPVQVIEFPVTASSNQCLCCSLLQFLVHIVSVSCFLFQMNCISSSHLVMSTSNYLFQSQESPVFCSRISCFLFKLQELPVSCGSPVSCCSVFSFLF